MEYDIKYNYFKFVERVSDIAKKELPNWIVWFVIYTTQTMETFVLNITRRGNAFLTKLTFIILRILPSK